MSPHLEVQGPAVDEIPSGPQESSGPSSQVIESRSPFNLDQEASKEACAVQAGRKAAPNGNGESSAMPPKFRDHVQRSHEESPEAVHGQIAGFAPSGANSSFSSISNLTVSLQTGARPEANSVLPDSSETSELRHDTSTFGHNEQQEGVQFRRTRAFSHGDSSITESRIKSPSSSGDQSISATNVTGAGALNSRSSGKRQSGFGQLDATSWFVGLRSERIKHEPQMEHRSEKSEAIRSESLEKLDPRGLALSRMQNDSPTILSNARGPPTDATRNTQRPNDKGPATREAKIHATLKRATDPRQFFVLGKVFLTLWVEPTGEMQSNNGSNLTVGSGISTVAFGERVFSNIRRFVVIREGERSCTALRIMTYGGLGVAKKGVQKSEHAIIYTGRQVPEPDSKERAKRGELGLLPRAIRVAVDDEMEKLDPMSRLDFGKVHTIGHSARIRGIGTIHKKSLEPFLYQFKSVFEKHGSHGRYSVSSSAEVSKFANEEPRRSARQLNGSRILNGQHSYGPSQKITNSNLHNLHLTLDHNPGRMVHIDANSDGYRSEDIETIRPNRTSLPDGSRQASGSTSGAASALQVQTRFSGYYRHQDRWFRRYRIIQVLWHDHADVPETPERNGGVAFDPESHKPCDMRCEPKSFVVLGATSRHSLCVPITASNSPNHAVIPEHRAVLYTLDDPDHAWYQKPPDAMLSPIKVRCRGSQNEFEACSRLEYGRVHTIEHTSRVKGLGWIHDTSHLAFDQDQDSVYRLITYKDPTAFSDSDDSDNSDYHSLGNDDERELVHEDGQGLT